MVIVLLIQLNISMGYSNITSVGDNYNSYNCFEFVTQIMLLDYGTSCGDNNMITID